MDHVFEIVGRGFNPCFDGSEARVWEIEGRGRGGPVSILVLMEVKRELNIRMGTTRSDTVSILVLMEVKREFSIQDDMTDAQRFQSLF